MSFISFTLEKSRRLPILAASLTAIVLSISSCVSDSKTPTIGCYSCRVEYVLNEPIVFPDFTISFLGSSEQKVEVQGRRIPFGPCYNFLVSADTQSQKICWSTGTGVIGPIQFLVKNSCYSLERLDADKLGKLRDNEFVISNSPRDWCRGN